MFQLTNTTAGVFWGRLIFPVHVLQPNPLTLGGVMTCPCGSDLFNWLSLMKAGITEADIAAVLGGEKPPFESTVLDIALEPQHKRLLVALDREAEKYDLLKAAYNNLPAEEAKVLPMQKLISAEENCRNLKTLFEMSVRRTFHEQLMYARTFGFGPNFRIWVTNDVKFGSNFLHTPSVRSCACNT
jgi:hypothetical protein